MATLTYVLPGDARSGGVRVTVVMANTLLQRGHTVRIVCPHRDTNAWAKAKTLGKKIITLGKDNSGWLAQFRGPIEYFRSLDDLTYRPGEVVVAVGTYTVPWIRAMTKNVIKVRSNHGFPAKPTGEEKLAWTGRMPTITVSHTLVPRLQEQTENSVWGVVPNGIDTTEYHIMPEVQRQGVGALFSVHPNKAPDDIIAILAMARERWPQVPQYVFGRGTAPEGIPANCYTRLPSVPAARTLYNQCRVWVLPSLTEGLPGVVLEAMACGCVVVSSDNEGSLEILRHEENGLIVPRGNRPAFIREIDRVLHDEALRTRLAAGAAATIKEFTWERAADRMEAFLRDLPTLT